MEEDCENTGFPHLDVVGLGALSLLGTAIYIYSFETQSVCWANRAALTLWNAESTEELYARQLSPFSQSTTLRLENYRLAFARGEDRWDTWTLYPRGQSRAVLCRCSGVSLHGHAHAMLVECNVDAESHVSGTELRSIEALRHTPLKITMFAQSGEVLMRNPTATALFEDFDRSLAPGTDHLQTMFADQSDYDELIALARRVPAARVRAVLRLPGSPIHALNLSVVTDPMTGQPAWLLVQEDVSLLVRTQRQLTASEDALDAVLNLNLTPVVVVAASDGRVLNINLSARNILDVRLDIGAGADVLFACPTDFAPLRAAALAGQAGAAPLRLRGPDGEAFWASLSAASISYDTLDAIAILITDIDAVYRTAADLEAALSSERTITDMQRRFLAIASHEFRTPLAVIDSAAQRLERTATQVADDSVRSRAARIRRAVAGLLQLLDNTVVRSLNNENMLGYKPETCDLTAIVYHAVAALQESAPDFTIKVDLPLIPAVHLDPALLEQAITNILANAIKYATEERQAEISGAVTTDNVELVIRDWGIGVPTEEHEKIFSDFVRGSNVGKTVGTGLGLAIVQQIIALHGGTIEAFDPDGPGLAVRITLPRH